MSFEDIQNAFYFGLFPVAAAIAIVVLPTIIWVALFAKLRVRGQYVFLLAFAALGGLLGYASGASQQSIIGTVLPTLLTLITLLLTYVFSKESISEQQPIIPYCLLALIASAFVCLFVGGQVKLQNENFVREYNRRLLYYEKVELEVEKARELQKLELEKPQP